MQEEVTQKTIALYVKVGKGAARLTEQALQKAIQKFLEQKSKPAHGKQTMRQLMKQNAGVSNIEITDSNIKAFESTAKKYNIDFSLSGLSQCQTPCSPFPGLRQSAGRSPDNGGCMQADAFSRRCCGCGYG